MGLLQDVIGFSDTFGRIKYGEQKWRQKNVFNLQSYSRVITSQGPVGNRFVVINEHKKACCPVYSVTFEALLKDMIRLIWTNTS